ncbi:MAG: low molecular weight phosphatase family protein [Actinomycetota bacterium]
MPTDVRVLTVCTHNRTRSVMMAALIARDLRARGYYPMLRSAGFGPEGIQAISDAVDAMARRGLDVSAHRSQQVRTDLLDDADLIVTAERDHVVKIAAMSPTAFARTMTLPEALDRAATGAGAGASDVRSWAAALTDGRRASEYLRARVPEVSDPTGSARRAFEAAVADIEAQCAQLVASMPT